MTSRAVAIAIACFASACFDDSLGHVSGEEPTSCDDVDTDTDPLNCGACGQACEIPNATPGCAGGECVVDTCDDGFEDDDGEVGNGCELAAAQVCTAGDSCVTECASAGTCDDAGAVCVPPAELCNAADDDCDGQCDEGAITGCRVGVHRSFGGAKGHLYTTDAAAAATAPFALETANYFRLYATAVPGTQQVVLCVKADGTYLITASSSCESIATLVRSLGYWSMAQRCGSVPLYRLHHAGANDHFFTVSTAERDFAIDTIGFTSQGIAGYVWASP